MVVLQAWGLKTTLSQTPHSAGSLRHWVRLFFFSVHIIMHHGLHSSALWQIVLVVPISPTFYDYLSWSGIVGSEIIAEV